MIKMITKECNNERWLRRNVITIRRNLMKWIDHNDYDRNYQLWKGLISRVGFDDGNYRINGLTFRVSNNSLEVRRRRDGLAAADLHLLTHASKHTHTHGHEKHEHCCCDKHQQRFNKLLTTWWNQINTKQSAQLLLLLLLLKLFITPYYTYSINI